MVSPADILLATLNAKFIHCAFGLRCLLANMGDLQPRTALLEFELQQRPLDIVEALLARRPRIVGLGIYIWNVRETTEVVAALKRVAPEVIVILGGPEVSFEWEEQEIVRLADHVITGEADLMFADVCRRLLGERIIPCSSRLLPHPDPAQESRGAAVPAAGSRGVPPRALTPPGGTPGESAGGDACATPASEAVLFADDSKQPAYPKTSPAHNSALTVHNLASEVRNFAPAAGNLASPAPERAAPAGKLASQAADSSPASGDVASSANSPAVADAPDSILRTALPKILAAELPQLDRVALPYDLYTEHDLAHRVIYVEASRGCPFTCEFCLSSLDIPVRQFPLEPFLGAMERLLARGATQFKFVDRTFNLNLMVSRAILQFFLARMRPGLFVHFEMVPDRLPEALREVIAQFPAGSLQFEVGVQTFDEATSRNISRRQDHARLADNLTWLRAHTGVHVHADLIVGLPGESLASFAAGFDRLVALGPQEIQVGILKRLRGTPIVRHDAEFAMRYNPQPPYELLGNRDLDFPTMQRLRRFARYWDLLANSGNFRTSTPLLWSAISSSRREEAPSNAERGMRNAELQVSLLTSAATESPFLRFLAFSDWLHARLGKRHGIALDTLAEALFDHLTRVLGHAPEVVARALLADFTTAGRRERPPFLQPFIERNVTVHPGASPTTVPKRQRRHLAAAAEG